MTRTELAQRLRARRMSCVEAVRTALDAIAKDPYNAFITVDAEGALTQARVRDKELARRHDRGPWHGIPIAHKDLLDVAGLRNTGACKLYADRISKTDAESVRRLREAGAICVGKTNLHELAYGATSQSKAFGPVLNPRGPERIPGGSSGGSAAAVAAAYVTMATGTDTGGSIRIPASYCGVVGLKPTYDLVSRQGCHPLAYSLDHIGPIATNVADCRSALEIMSGREFAIQRYDFRNLRVCLPSNFFFEHVDPTVADSVREAAARFASEGAQVSESAIPEFGRVHVAAKVVQSVETAAVYSNQTDSMLFGEDIWALFQQGRMIAGHEYVNAQRIRGQLRAEFDEFWNDFDVIVAPATPITAPLRTERTVSVNGVEEEVRMASTRLTRGINLLGEPAISLPCGTDARGLPIGLQLIAAPGRDGLLLDVAEAAEKLLAN